MRADIRWKDVESVLLACEAEITEGRGSRVRVALGGVRAVFHQPHPHSMMEYKGDAAGVEFDEQAEVFHGEVTNIRDVVTFEGRTVNQLRKAFRDSVDDYLAFCAQRGEKPEKPFSGKFIVRVNPKLHRAVSLAAAKDPKSLNASVAERFAEAVRQQ